MGNYCYESTIYHYHHHSCVVIMIILIIAHFYNLDHPTSPVIKTWIVTMIRNKIYIHFFLTVEERKENGCWPQKNAQMCLVCCWRTFINEMNNIIVLATHSTHSYGIINGKSINKNKYIHCFLLQGKIKITNLELKSLF